MQRSILITGCSTGIGWCAAATLQQQGWRVFATARRSEDLARLDQLGVTSIPLEMQDSASIRLAVATVVQKTGGTLDALFNNVGYAIPGAVEDLTRDMMRAQFETNVFGLMELTNLVVPVMRRQGHGRIVHNTSILGIVTMPYRGNYNASKFALEAYTTTLRQELRDTAIKVSIIAPGPIATQFRQTAHRSFTAQVGDKPTVHADNYRKMAQYFSATAEPAAGGGFTLPPAAVVRKLLHAVHSNKPKARYYVGLPAHLLAWLRRLLPESALDWIIAKMLRDERK